MAEQPQTQQPAQQQQPQPAQQQLIDSAVVLQTIANLGITPDTEQDHSDSYSSSSDYESDDEDPQSLLDKAGCITQLSNLELTPEGSVPLELLVECVQCLLFDKLWAALILCKAITTLQPSNVIAVQLQQLITMRIQQKLEQEFEGSECSESASGDESGSEDSCESDSDSDSESESEGNNSATESQDEAKKEDTHTCPACTN
eukprot:TRINITY_DN1794_c0_g1_i1.p1 TRINITY_DN1794_c0_g1~~TRINITY_DN1794_c0_g1_i1.p1  ORF type:complete len:222 (-),score=68.11 TRINITY_DN1794_c0_g1_i1:224-829(-)